MDNGDIKALQDRVVKWADRLYPDRTVHGALSKLVLEEIPEFLMKPTDPLEYADLLIMIFDIAHLSGIDIKEAVLAKIAINEARRWRIDKNGIMGHYTEKEFDLWFMDLQIIAKDKYRGFPLAEQENYRSFFEDYCTVDDVICEEAQSQ